MNAFRRLTDALDGVPADEWEKPVPLRDTPPPPPFPLPELPTWQREWVSEISAEKGASPDIAANLSLSVLSGALARNVQVSPRPGWWEPTNLYSILGLQPGQRKSPVFKSALRPLHTLERRRATEHRENVRAQELAVKLFDKHEQDLLRQAEADPEKILEQLGERPAAPGPTPRLLAEDVTAEALAGLIGDHGRIIVASDEGAALFENLAGRYTHGSASWDVFNKAHAGMELTVDRKRSDPIKVYDSALTIAIVTQPTLLRSLGNKPDTGERGGACSTAVRAPRTCVRGRSDSSRGRDHHCRVHAQNHQPFQRRPGGAARRGRPSSPDRADFQP